jgi:hypothetical protein
MQAGANPTLFEGVGMVSLEDGHYYLTTDEDVKYGLTCKDFKKYVGTKVVISGNLPATATLAEGATPELCVRSLAINGPSGMSTTAKLIIAGVIVGSAVGIGVGLYEANQSSPPASR